MRYLHKNITVSVELSLPEIDNLYLIVSGDRGISHEVKDNLLRDLTEIVKLYKANADQALRLYDATDKERINF